MVRYVGVWRDRVIQQWVEALAVLKEAVGSATLYTVEKGPGGGLCGGRITEIVVRCNANQEPEYVDFRCTPFNHGKDRVFSGIGCSTEHCSIQYREEGIWEINLPMCGTAIVGLPGHDTRAYEIAWWS